MTSVYRYRWDTPEYADAFATLLQCYHGRENVIARLRELLAGYPREGRGADWGAGSGVLTRILLERFSTVFAVEPHPTMRKALAEQVPQAQLLPATILETTLPEPVQVGVISHVFYHIPDHKWPAHVMHAARQLTSDGVLIVVLKGPDSGCNDMLHHFGAPRFDLLGQLHETILQHKEFEFTLARSRAYVRADSFENILKVARFMLADRDADCFSRTPSETEFQHYARARFWSEADQQGGWDVDDVLCILRRNPRYSS